MKLLLLRLIFLLKLRHFAAVLPTNCIQFSLYGNFGVCHNLTHRTEIRLFIVVFRKPRQLLHGLIGQHQLLIASVPRVQRFLPLILYLHKHGFQFTHFPPCRIRLPLLLFPLLEQFLSFPLIPVSLSQNRKSLGDLFPCPVELLFMGIKYIWG